MIFQNNLYNELLYAFIVLICIFVIGKSLLFILHKIIKKTKIMAVEHTYAGIKNPIFLMIVSFGIYLGIKILSSLKDYSNIISKVFVIWFTFLFAFIIVRFLRSLTKGYFTKLKQDGTRKSKLDKTAINFIENTLSVVVYVAMGLILLGFFNVKITPLLAALGIAGLAVALALQDTLSNLFASIYLVKERPVNIGDYVKLENGEEGYVESISWRNSTIKTLPNNRLVIPNSTLSKMIITNYNYPTKDMAVVLPCGVAYGSDLKKVEKVTTDTAKKTLKSVSGGCKDFEPFIRYHTFGDSNIQFSIILRVNEYVDKYLVTHEFIKNLTEAYRKNKIEISWPVRKIYYGKDKD